MKKSIKISISIFLSLFLLTYLYYWAFIDMKRLPKGDFLLESTSPQKTYTIKGYISKGNATVSDAIRAELHFNNEDKKTKNIYWQNREYNIKIVWLDDDTVKINDKIIELPDGKFDFRNQ